MTNFNDGKDWLKSQLLNQELLNGVSCPKCGSNYRFNIEATTWFVVSDKGADEHAPIQVFNDSRIQCRNCQEMGTVQVFKARACAQCSKELDPVSLGAGFKPKYGKNNFCSLNCKEEFIRHDN